MTLGAIGCLLSIAVAVIALLFISRANNVVGNVEDRVTKPVDRLDTQIEEASEAITAADGGELSARLAIVADQATSASTATDTITEHPLYGWLPIDTDSLENRLTSVEAVAAQIGELRTDDLSGDERSTISSSLDDLAGLVDSVDSAVQDTGDSLRFWIRVSGLAFVALALWSLWAQITLFRHGRQADR